MAESSEGMETTNDIFIYPSDFNNIKALVDAEVNRRSNAKSVSPIAAPLAYATTPATGTIIDVEDINNMVTPLNNIDNTTISKIITKSEDDFIVQDPLPTVKSVVTKYSSFATHPLNFIQYTNFGAIIPGISGFYVDKNKWEQYSGCNKSCQGTCLNSCYNTCEGCTGSCSGCSGTCEGSCGTDCTGKCDNTCNDTCKDGCKNTCEGNCTNTCSGGCSGCDTTCDGCSGSCGDNCTGSCGSGCAGGCLYSCDNCGIF